jgi:rhodanese-related sulfurtransferase
MTLDFEIRPEDVKAALEKGEAFTLLDVREPWESEVARIERSKLIPMGDVPARAHQELDPDERIIAYCHRGIRSLNVVNWLRQQGFENAQSMAGGIDRWSRVIDPKIPTY